MKNLTNVYRVGWNSWQIFHQKPIPLRWQGSGRRRELPRRYTLPGPWCVCVRRSAPCAHTHLICESSEDVVGPPDSGANPHNTVWRDLLPNEGVLGDTPERMIHLHSY